uniref:TRAF-type zinc finger domain containing 1 n=2 Tax=Sphenodon punctatus TaxID=8508 RepID=A0A8D0GS41_SPHPU
MVKDLKDHPEVCGKEGEETRVRRERPRYALEDRDADLCTNQIIQNHLGSDGYVETLPRMTRLPESRFYSHFGRDQVLRDENRRNASSVQRAQNPEQEQLERNINSVPSLYGEQDADFDYMLALSLQSETNPCNNTAVGIHRDFWQNFFSKASGLSRCFNESNYSDIFSHDPVEAVNVAHQRKNDIMLPCEFCEVLFPEDDLILHQTGCNPASALASFSKRSSSPSRHSHGGHLRDFLGQLHGTESSRYQSTYLSQQQGVEMDGGSIIIPCEFCGIQLEEEVLFHHQDQCDLRPATANSERSSSQQTLLSSRPQEGMESPDLPRRHIRHQGEISPGYLEEFRQQALVHPVQGSRPVSNFAVARNIRPIFPGGTARDNDALNAQRVKVGNLSAGEGRTRDPEAVSLPTGRPPHNRHPESYVPSFPRMSPIRPSARNEEGRSPRVANGPANFRNRSVKAKPQKPKSGYPDKEE